uniref:Cysteine-rich PDZ-binding protein n=1 Tax=Steinernema glaseri TaxID=37863 RepID=A0A1I8ANE2_9BILA
MVCEKCETKLSRLATTTVRKSKLETKPGQSSKKITSENKLLSAQENGFGIRFKAKEDFKKCRICNHSTHKMGCHYCATCAYQKGICAMCGRKITKVSLQRQSLE